MCVYIRATEVYTWRRAHPVGMKANKQAKISATVSSRNLMKMKSTTTAAMNVKSFSSLKTSWKSALSLILPIDTIWQ